MNKNRLNSGRRFRAFCKARPVVLIALVLGGTGLIQACVNWSYTFRDEKQMPDDVERLVSGAMPIHGKYFYEHHLMRSRKALSADPDDVTALNDLAVAQLKLGKWEAAQKTFDRIERLEPGRYETHSNLAVMYKKMGLTSKAVTHMQQALVIRPGGHMKLGDYYLRMLTWMEQEDETPRQTNFLGVPYEAGWSATAVATGVRRDYLITLIKNDRHFADGYIVLGDVLMDAGETRAAILAYAHARVLGHYVGGLRLDSVYESLREQAGPLRAVAPFAKQARLTIQEADLWCQGFVDAETELIHAGESPDFEAVFKVVDARQPLFKVPVLVQVYFPLHVVTTFSIFLLEMLLVPYLYLVSGMRIFTACTRRLQLWTAMTVVYGMSVAVMLLYEMHTNYPFLSGVIDFTATR